MPTQACAGSWPAFQEGLPSAGSAPPPGTGPLCTTTGRGCLPLWLQLQLPAEGGGLLEEPVQLAQASGSPEQIPPFPYHHRR